MAEKIILDLETTGLDFKEDKIIEICCIKLIKRKLSKKKFHFYLNPLKKISFEAKSIHGIKDEFLKDKPFFFEIVYKFLRFIFNKDIIIHNSQFDLNFLNNELSKLGLKKVNDYCHCIIDTLEIAKRVFPGKRNSLNALCKRLNVNLDFRKLHGACIDVKLLFQVYLLITRKENKLIFNQKVKTKIFNVKPKNIVIKAENEDIILHNYILSKLNISK